MAERDIEMELHDGMERAIVKATYLRESHDRLHKALSDLVQTFHARPDILQLCGPHEHAQLREACDALNHAA